MTSLATFLIVLQAIFSLFTPAELANLDVTVDNGVVTKAEIATPTTGINIVCVGDSNTAGTHVSIDKRYCDMLGLNNSANGITSYNAGFTTLTTTDLITRNVTAVYPYKVAGKRNIATLMIGTNDFYFNHPIEQYWSDMKTVIANLKANGFEVWVMTYPPRVGDTARNIYLRTINSRVLSNATLLGYRGIDTHIEIVEPTNQDQVKSGMMNADLIHLTELSHQVVYAKLIAELGLSTPVVVIPTSTGTTSSGVLAMVSTTDKASEIIVTGNTISSNTNAWKSVRGTVGKSSGKWYWEVKNETTNNKYWIRGIGKSTATLTDRVGIDANGNAWYNDGSSSLRYTGNSPVNYGGLSLSGDIIGFALDMDAGTLTAYKNGISQGIMYSGLIGTYYPMFSVYGAGPTMTVNFGATPLVYPVAGFSSIIN